VSLIRFARMHGRPHPPDRVALHESARYVNGVRHLAGLGQGDGELALADAGNTCGRSGDTARGCGKT
jgi:beta-N-acetylhexosaminidase